MKGHLELVVNESLRNSLNIFKDPKVSAGNSLRILYEKKHHREGVREDEVLTRAKRLRGGQVVGAWPDNLQILHSLASRQEWGLCNEADCLLSD